LHRGLRSVVLWKDYSHPQALALVFISTVGKVVNSRQAARALQPPPPGAPGEIEGLREAVDHMSDRLERLEEERDFYRNLLEAPERPREVQPPDLGGGGSGP